MTEAEYEYECRRAELLGIDIPNREEFFSRKHSDVEQATDAEDGAEFTEELERLEELERQGESISRTSGGLDEINNILSVTQKKINYLKTVCGSFTGILKFQSHCNKSETSSPTHKKSVADEADGSNKPQNDEVSVAESKATEINKSIQGDIESSVCVQLSKLDSIIMKAEKANLSLSSQNKQMKMLLKK